MASDTQSTSSEPDRETVRDWYQGHEIDEDTGVHRFSQMEGPVKDSPIMVGETADDDTEVDIGPKEQENPNDPYCTC